MSNYIISIPFINETEFINDERLDFYQTVDIPTIQGGREPYAVAKFTPSVQETLDRIDMYGKRYKVLANSTNPEWSQNFRKVCEKLNEKKGILILANLEFATEVKSQYPDIELHASVIMGLFYNFREVLASPLFTVVGVPNLWHYSFDTIFKAIPVEHRERVNIIVLKYCIWDGKCKEHYSTLSNWHKSANKAIYQCTSTPKYFKIPLITAGPLYKEGFRRFKLAARYALSLDYECGKQLVRERIQQIADDIKLYE